MTMKNDLADERLVQSAAGQRFVFQTCFRWCSRNVAAGRYRAR